MRTNGKCKNLTPLFLHIVIKMNVWPRIDIRWGQKLLYLSFCPLIITSINTIDFELKKVLLPLGNFADITYLKESFKPHL